MDQNFFIKKKSFVRRKTSRLEWVGCNPADQRCLLISQKQMFRVRLLSTSTVDPLPADQCREEEGRSKVKRKERWTAVREEEEEMAAERKCLFCCFTDVFIFLIRWNKVCLWFPAWIQTGLISDSFMQH